MRSPPSRRPRRALAPLCAAALLCACAGPEVSFNRHHPSVSVRRVAVAGFEGPGGAAAADFLAHALLAAGADVVERGRLEAVLREQSLSGAGALEARSAKHIGRLLGVDALLMGSVTQYSPPQSFLVWASTEPFLLQGGAAQSGLGLRRTPGPGADRVTSAALVGMTARMVDVETGSLLWSAHQSYEGFDLDSAMAAIASSFARTLSPLWPR